MKKSNNIHFVWSLFSLIVFLLPLVSCSFPANDPNQNVQRTNIPDPEQNLPSFNFNQTPIATSIPEPKPQEKPDFEILQVLENPKADGSLEFSGTFRNLSDQPRDYTLITIDLLDSNGESLLSQSEYSLLDVTFPQQMNAFKVVFSGFVPDWKAYQVTIAGDDYLGEYLHPALKLGEISTAQDGNLYQITGQILNEGVRGALSIQVLVLLYDSQDQLISAATVPAQISYIPAGKHSSFEFSWDQSQSFEVSSYDLVLQGYLD